MDRETYMVAFSADHTAAYLLAVWKDKCSVVAHWFKDRPDISLFDPARWRLGQAYAGQGGTFYDAEPVSGYF